MGRAKAIWSLVCGIIALVAWPAAMVLGPLSIGLGISVIREKHDGRGMAIGGIATGAVGFAIFLVIMLLAYFGAIGPTASAQTPEPVLITDTGFILKAGESRTVNPLAAGTYEFEVTSTDGLTLTTYVSNKDFELARANGRGAEYYSDCSTTKSTRFHTTCTLPQGAVFAMTNPNLFQEINVNVRITKLR